MFFFQIYESCFGEEVVRQIRQEMIQACAKCVETSAPPPPIHEEKPPERPQEEEGPNPNQGQFDPEKMPQAILAFRPVSTFIQLHDNVFAISLYRSLTNTFFFLECTTTFI